MSVSITKTKSPAEVNLSRNECIFRFAAGGNNGETNIRIHLTLSLQIGGDTTAVPCEPLSALVDDDGVAEFDVSFLLQNADNYAFTYPEDSLGAVKQESLVSKFIAAYSCSYTSGGTHYTNQGYTMTSAYYYINGGLSTDDLGYLSAQGSDWWTFFSENQLFLNFMPGAKRTILQSSERLYWYAFRTSTEETLKITCTASDGSISTYTKSIAMVEHSIYEINVSPALVEAEMEGKTLVRYTVEIDGYIGEQEYYINTLSTINALFFLFQNQYGVWETLWCKGQLTETHTYDKTAVEIKTALQASQLVHGKSYITNQLNQTGVISTGILDGNDWALWASDIISGAPVYLTDGVYIYPVAIDTNASVVKQVPNYDFLYLSVKYTYSKRTKFPNRLLTNTADVLVATQEDGAVLTTEDGEIIIYK